MQSNPQFVFWTRGFQKGGDPPFGKIPKELVCYSFVINMSSVGGESQSCGLLFPQKIQPVLFIKSTLPILIIYRCVSTFKQSVVIENRTLCDISCKSTMVGGQFRTGKPTINKTRPGSSWLILPYWSNEITSWHTHFSHKVLNALARPTHNWWHFSQTNPTKQQMCWSLLNTPHIQTSLVYLFLTWKPIWRGKYQKSQVHLSLLGKKKNWR